MTRGKKERWDSNGPDYLSLDALHQSSNLEESRLLDSPCCDSAQILSQSYQLKGWEGRGGKVRGYDCAIRFSTCDPVRPTPTHASPVDLLHRNICSLLVSRQNGIMAKYHRLMLKEAEVR